MSLCIDSLIQGLHSLRNKKVWVAPLTELVFFIVLGLVTAPIFERIVVYAQAYFSALAGQAPQIIQGMFSGAPIETAKGLLIQLLLIYLVLLVAVYLTYVLFQGMVWWIISRRLELKSEHHTQHKTENSSPTHISLKSYLPLFAKASVLWVVCYGVLHLLTLVADFQALASVRLGNSPPFFWSIILPISFILLIYFSGIDYTLLLSKKSQWQRITQGVKIFPKIFPLALFIILIFYALDILLAWSETIHLSLLFIIGIFISLPAFTYFRLVWADAVTQLSKTSFWVREK